MGSLGEELFCRVYYFFQNWLQVLVLGDIFIFRAGDSGFCNCGYIVQDVFLFYYYDVFYLFFDGESENLGVFFVFGIFFLFEIQFLEQSGFVIFSCGVGGNIFIFIICEIFVIRRSCSKYLSQFRELEEMDGEWRCYIDIQGIGSCIQGR